MQIGKLLGNTNQQGADLTKIKTIKGSNYFKMSRSLLKARISSRYNHRATKLAVKECRVIQVIKSLKKRKCKACSQLKTR